MTPRRAIDSPPLTRTFVLPCLWLAACFLNGSTVAGEAPEQFRVWGKQAKADPYLGDAGLDTPGTAGVEASAEETARGFAVFAKPAAFVIKPDFAPGAADRCTALNVRDCAGQYGPLTFAVFALRRGEFSVAVTDLAGPGGKTIGAEHFDGRAVRCCKVLEKQKPNVIPLLIEAAGKTTVREKRMQQFWLTYRIPDDAAAGTYEGKVRILVDGAEKLALPLKLEVYPFTLVEPDVSLYIYYNNSTAASDLEVIQKELVDMRCHGMNVSTFGLPVTRDGDLTREAAAPFLDAYQKAGFARPRVNLDLWNRITAEWLNTPDKSIQMWGPWFRYYPFSEKLDKRYVATVKMLQEEAKKRGADVILAVADEAGSHPWTTEATQHYNALIKKEVPDVIRELTVGGGWAMKRPEDELWKGLIGIWTTNRWLPDKLELVRKNDPSAKIQLYNMGGNGSGPGGIESVRALYGFFAWKARAAGAAQWTYYHGATPECNYAWPPAAAGEAKVPTLRWEMVREGAKDRRYLATLEARMAAKPGPVADDARRFLDEIAAKIVLRTDEYDPIGGGRVPVPPPGTFDQWREKIAEFIGKL
ncbi:MAG: hypothetical protein NTW87_21210 [Planctomycetota bacterium]|nr:hypothetical protein [Planctomycetota bacterium]